jgi:hypothetical protein
MTSDERGYPDDDRQRLVLRHLQSNQDLSLRPGPLDLDDLVQGDRRPARAIAHGYVSPDPGATAPA